MSTTAKTEIMRQSDAEVLRVLVLGSESSSAKLAQTIEEAGFEASLSDDLHEVLAQLAGLWGCAVVYDAELPSMDGLSFVREAQQVNPCVQVILVTESCSADGAIEAIRHGAYDCVLKPAQRLRLKATLDALAERLRRRKRIQEIERQLSAELDFHGMRGCSAAILEVFDEAQKIARHFSSVLLLGPVGTGKELLAHAIHQMSPAAGQRFMVCHCASVGSELESQLFGRLWDLPGKQPNGQKPGISDSATGGTVFLEDVGKTPLAVQAKLLQVIAREEADGASPSPQRRATVRVIAATADDLRAEVLAGRFREELFCLLSKVQIRVPALAERREDIPLLAQFFLDRYGPAYHKRIHGITRSAMGALQRYEWPGNVRELENVISAAALADVRGLIELRDLPEHLQRPAESKAGENIWQPLPLREVRREHIERVLDFCHGNRVRAAQLLGIGRTSPYRHLKRRSRTKSAANVHAALEDGIPGFRNLKIPED